MRSSAHTYSTQCIAAHRAHRLLLTMADVLSCGASVSIILQRGGKLPLAKPGNSCWKTCEQQPASHSAEQRGKQKSFLIARTEGGLLLYYYVATNGNFILVVVVDSLQSQRSIC